MNSEHKQKYKALCCFPIESKSREFDSRLYLSLLFLRHNYASLIGSRGGVNTFFNTINLPAIYFFQGIKRIKVDFINKLKSKNAIIVNLDEENYSAISHNAYNYMIKGRNPKDILHNFDHIFTWSEQLREKLLEYAAEFQDNQISTVGNARFDLRKPGFKELYNSKVIQKHGVKPGFILINTSFGVGNSNLTLNLLLEKMQKGYQEFYDEAFQISKHNYQKRIAYLFLSAASRLAETFPEVDVVIRPHPAENLSTYTHLHRNPKNLFIIKDGLAHDWISSCKLMIHQDCTTGLEAIFYKIPTISYCPEMRLDLIKDLCVLASFVVSDEDSLVDTIAKVLKGETDLEPDEQRLSYVRTCVDNVSYSAGEKIVSTITQRFQHLFEDSSLKLQNSVSIDNISLMEYIKKSTRPIRKYFSGLYSRHSTEEDHKQKLLRQRRLSKFDELTRGEVERFAEKLHCADSSLPRVHVKQLGPNAFLLTRK